MAAQKGRAGLAGTVALVLLLSSCGAFQARTDKSLEDLTPEQIYKQGEYTLETGKPEDAAETFSEVERLYPYSVWAKRALIMQAFAFHRARDYENSRATAQRYLDFTPPRMMPPTRNISSRCPTMTRSTRLAAIRASPSRRFRRCAK